MCRAWQGSAQDEVHGLEEGRQLGHAQCVENFTFDDAASGYIPSSTTVVTGTYKPAFSQGALIDQSFNGSMPAPAPSDSTGPTLSIFNGVDPNGAWSLFVYDGFNGDSGMISGGWSLQLTLGPASGTLNLATPVLDKPIVNEGEVPPLGAELLLRAERLRASDPVGAARAYVEVGLFEAVVLYLAHGGLF